MSEYEIGKRIRITFDSTVQEETPEVMQRAVRLGKWETFGVYAVAHPDTVIVSVEKLPDPEPEWQKGDYAMTADGHVCEFTGNGVWRNTRSHIIYDRDIWRPLTLLIRDGKRVDG